MATFVGHRCILASLNEQSKHARKGESPVCSMASCRPIMSATKPSFRDIVVRSIEPCVRPNLAFVEYEVEMANQKTGLVWTIHRRFSMFMELQNAIDALFGKTHCVHCTELNDRVQQLELPPKWWGLTRLWGPTEADLKLRARMFASYVSGLIQLGATKMYRQCPLVADGYLHLVMSFLASMSNGGEISKIEQKTAPRAPPASESSSVKPVPPKMIRRKSSGKFKALETIFEQDPAVVC
ncbi:hypothetical protein LEN26_019881 [Aphanomyces euteiches]|nr:hypothetical protein LEN26_019881 [Aphanomyces euteiches]